MVYLLIIVALDALFYNRFCFFYVAPPLYDGAARLFQVFIVRKVVLCLGLPLRDVIKTRNAVVITVVGFSLLVLGYDSVWDYRGRPTWITTARSYELIDSASRSLVEVLAERRARILGQDAQPDSDAE